MKLHQIHYAKKSFIMVYVGTYDCCKNIKMKFWSTITLLKPWHCNFDYKKKKKKMIVEFNYVL